MSKFGYSRPGQEGGVKYQKVEKFPHFKKTGERNEALEAKKGDQSKFQEDLDYMRRGFSEAIEKVKSGEVPSNKFVDYERILDYPEDTSKMSKTQHQLYRERVGLAEKLRTARLEAERGASDIKIADSILEKRKTSLQGRLEKMTPEERKEFDRKQADFHSGRV